MGKVPESAVVKEIPKTKKEATIQAPAKKKLNCFVMPDKPGKPGLVMVSTSKDQDGCYVLGWQEQSTTLLISSGAEWYGYASKLLKVNLAFSAVYAFLLLVVLVFNRRVR